MDQELPPTEPVNEPLPGASTEDRRPNLAVWTQTTMLDGMDQAGLENVVRGID